MLLKSIDIKGFKSFADKTELEFKKGITALVGPNGSGKSNISDAVKWVLGEQSVKSLRGNKMEDIIFAGTKYRKSVGLAYVSLTLDNSLKELPIDYSDVTISRRLYRSGDSEYYINNTQCRLKDIQELFMDTGIGKEGYSIIGQGKIDAILNGRSEDRRGLFEEAAGIVKYKTRKLEAQRKLDKTSDNLIRINDILSTYEDRIEPLGIESEKAKQFLDYSNDLKVKEINVILDAIDKYNIRLNSIDQAIKNFDEKFSILINSKTVQEETLVDLNSALQSLEEKNNLNKKLYYEKKSAFQSFQGESNVINERIDNLSKIIEKSTNDITISENKISDMSSCLDQVVKERSIDLSSQNNLLNKINEKISNGNINIKLNEENKLKLDNLKEEDIDLLSLIAEVKNSTIILKNDSEVFKNRLNEIKMTCEDYKKMININSINQESLTKSI
ncbi:MAG: chromosome segregation SMC family protein, partial [Clostridiaceae bacterium]